MDGSQFAENAGITAADLARRYSARLIILHVAKYRSNELEIDAHSVAVGLPLSDPVVDKLKHEVGESMLRVVTYAKSLGVVVDQQTTNTSSSIEENISNFAYRNEVDLVVLGTRGLNEFKTSLLGSVSEGLVKHSRCSVLVVKSPS